MSTIELAAIVAGALMAIARLARVAAPLWKYGPPWVQTLLTTLPLLLTQIAGQLGAVATELDLASVLLFAGLTITAAVGDARRGVHFAGVLLLAGLAGSSSGCAYLDQQPAKVVDDAFLYAKEACAMYEEQSVEYHTPEMDKACRSLRLVCE